MARIEWDKTGERFYETGVDHGVLYVLNTTTGVYDDGVAWNGLTSVSESPSGAEANPQYADNIKYLNLVSAETFGATIEAFTYPKEFEACDGYAEIAPGAVVGQQNRATFGFSYRTKVGNELNGDLGYKIHLIYGALAAPSERAYATVNESPEAMTMSWEITTTPVAVEGHRPTASITLDSRTIAQAKMAAIEDVLYGGSGATKPKLPLPAEIITLLAA